jgi:hypothetical protein
MRKHEDDPMMLGLIANSRKLAPKKPNSQHENKTLAVEDRIKTGLSEHIAGLKKEHPNLLKEDAYAEFLLQSMRDSVANYTKVVSGANADANAVANAHNAPIEK